MSKRLLTLKIVLLQLGYTQREVADFLGTSEGRISDAINGRTALRPDEQTKLSQLLGRSVESLFGKDTSAQCDDWTPPAA